MHKCWPLILFFSNMNSIKGNKRVAGESSWVLLCDLCPKETSKPPGKSCIKNTHRNLKHQTLTIVSTKRTNLRILRKLDAVIKPCTANVLTGWLEGDVSFGLWKEAGLPEALL